MRSRKFEYDSTMASHIFVHSQEYDDLGQLEVGEELLTVQNHVFSQIGVLECDGVRAMESDWIDDEAYIDVFCDVGSGVGNVCVQVLADVRNCRKVVGVEVIPSRHNRAVEAIGRARRSYPHLFTLEKEAVFLNCDLVGCAPRLNSEKVTVLFSHSWMFDDDLMEKFSVLVKECPALRMVITSRPLVHSDGFELSKTTHYSTDWNPECPFYVYRRTI